MTCQEFEQIVADLAGDNVTLARTRIAALTHAAVCAQCDSKLSAEKALTEGLIVFAEQTSKAQASSRLKQSLRVAFETQHAAKGAEVAPSNVIRLVDHKPVVRHQWTWVVAAAAAVVIFAFAVFLWRNQRNSETPVFVAGSSPTPALTPRVPNEMASRQNDLDTTQLHTTAVNEVGTAKKSPPQNRPRRVQAAEKELAANYIPLNYAAASAMSDESLVVRVDVSRTTLITMGLPLSLNAESGNEMVKADLKVGLDGVPLAIRLVR